MSQERDVVVITSKGAETRDLLEEDIKKVESKEEKRARFARVLERGFIVDRCTVENLPPHLHGEWVPKDPIEVERKKALGFWVDEEYAHRRALHSDGSQTIAQVGDCIFMTCLKEDKDLIDEIRQEAYNRMHGSPGQEVRRDQREEREFKTQAQMIDVPTPVIDTGREKTMRKAELEAALSPPKQ